MILALALFAQSVGDEPRRSGADVTSALSAIDLQACVARRLSMHGFVTTVPINKGVAFDWNGGKNLIGLRGKAPLTIEVTDDGALRHMTAAYRHPFSRKAAIKFLREVVKNCAPESLVQLEK